MTPLAGRRSRAGVVAVEFALCASVLVLLYFGTISVGVLTWAQSALQSVSAQTARCLALGSTACTNGPQYAVTLAQQRLFAGVIAAADVSVTAGLGCAGATGQYTVVTITSHFWSNGALAAPFNAIVLTAKSCYPSHS